MAANKAMITRVRRENKKQMAQVDAKTSVKVHLNHEWVRALLIPVLSLFARGGGERENFPSASSFWVPLRGPGQDCEDAASASFL